jgi:prevent-host-death family protein
MKVVSVTEVRQDTAKVIRHAQETEEPVLVVSRSKPAVYIVGAAHYEALLAELKEIRREAFLREVEEAEAEIRRGGLPVYESAEELIASLRADDQADDDR